MNAGTPYSVVPSLLQEVGSAPPELVHQIADDVPLARTWAVGMLLLQQTILAEAVNVLAA